MSRKKLPLIFIFILSFSFLAQAASVEYRFRITYILENRGDEAITVEDGYVTVIDFPDNDHQSVSITDSSHGILGQDVDSDGNSFHIMDVDRVIPARSNLTFYTVYTALSEGWSRPDFSSEEAGLISDISEELVNEFCIETETFNWTGSVRDLAYELAGNETSVYGVVTLLVEWINDNVEYVNFERPQYPVETYTSKKGDCDDQAILLISMLRSLGVPSYLQVGVIFHESIGGEKTVWDGHMTSSQDGIGWHGWAMVYMPPWGWVPVDLTMVSSKNPEDSILLAPEYSSYIVKAYDVSMQEYIGEGIKEMTRIVEGDIYVTVVDVALSAPSSGGLDIIGILTVTVGALAIVSMGYLVYTIMLRPRSSREFLD